MSHKTGTRERTQLFANAKPYAPAVTRNEPIKRSDAMYDQLEAQHDEQFGALSSKISALKDITSRIGSEVKVSTSLLTSLEERFDGARSKVKFTLSRVIDAADRTGVSWRSWIGLFLIFGFCFWFVMFL